MVDIGIVLWLEAVAWTREQFARGFSRCAMHFWHGYRLWSRGKKQEHLWWWAYTLVFSSELPVPN